MWINGRRKMRCNLMKKFGRRIMLPPFDGARDGISGAGFDLTFLWSSVAVL
jgi:hypothetical protein